MTREEAIKVLSSYDVNGVWADVDGKPYNAEEQAEAFDMAIEALQAEPVKHGKWTITDTDDGEGGEAPHLICSECKHEPLAWSSKRFFNYCPNCGAKMDG